MDPSGTQATISVGPIAIGLTIANRYEIRAPLGAGGMGTVYRAYDRELDEEVALKVLKPELAATSDAVERFRREVKLARRVTHPNVARTYDLGEHDGVRFLTMELVAGEQLHAPVAIPELLRIAFEISQGLAAAHAAGVVHRDLKPGNVIIAGERVVLTDFGIAHDLAGVRTTVSVIGTPAYMAPEQLEGTTVDGRADVYALGVMLYELVTARLPFSGEGTNAVAFARLSRPPDPLGPSVPEGVARLIMDSLARRREDRPDAHTLASRIARLRGTGGGGPSRTRLSASVIEAPIAAQRTVLVAPFDADDATRMLAADISTAIGDALVKVPGIRLVRDDAEYTVQATVRCAGDRVRFRLRLVDARGELAWADRVEGLLGDPFALEDAVTELVMTALRARAGRSGGPQGPIRERYEAARSLMAGGPTKMRGAIANLEELERDYPDDPWVTSLLSRALIIVGMQTGASDESLFGRAEELALRALDRDPSNGQAFHAIAVIRSIKGDHAGALAASREALRYAPMTMEPHLMIGRVLCSAGRIAEGLQRVELAMRLEPTAIEPIEEKIRVLALIGDREAARRELARVEQIHPMAGILTRLRLFAWWQDRDLAAETAAMMVKTPSAGTWQTARPMLEAYGKNDMPAMRERLDAPLTALTSARVIPRQRAFMTQIACELYLLAGDTHRGLDHLGELGAISSFIDLLWLDRCPRLVPVREHVNFAQVRAITAERVRELLE